MRLPPFQTLHTQTWQHGPARAETRPVESSLPHQLSDSLANRHLFLPVANSPLTVSVIEIPSGQELARLATKRRVVYDVALTDDDRYALVTVEGLASEPGTVEATSGWFVAR